jgi:hypothetical protein
MSDLKDKVRLSIDCSAEERRMIKALSALNDQTINDWVMALVREKLKRVKGHEPNEETVLALKESESGEGVSTYKSIDELFNDLEI